MLGGEAGAHGVDVEDEFGDLGVGVWIDPLTDGLSGEALLAAVDEEVVGVFVEGEQSCWTGSSGEDCWRGQELSAGEHYLVDYPV